MSSSAPLDEKTDPMGVPGSSERDLDDPPTDKLASDFQLGKLNGVIRRLEHARKIRSDEAASWASLGKDRPEQLGDFILGSAIGRGGMGVVVEAKQITLDRTVALKILPRDAFRDATSRRRFASEAQTIARLHHTHIVPVYGVGFDIGYHYFVMQRLNGFSALEHLERSGPFTSEQVARLGSQAADAIAHAHQQGVLHRDIKPSNLIVDTSASHLWITDFGVAKSVLSEAITQDGDAVGTFRYMAPEQMTGDVDGRSDIYSLGLTLREMLTGKAAIGDEQIAQAMAGKTSLRADPLAKSVPDAPRDLVAIIETACQSDPDDRYASADALCDDLLRFLHRRPVSVRPLSLPSRAYRFAKRYPAISGLSAALVLALASIAITMTVYSFRLQESYSQQQRSMRIAQQTATTAVDALDDMFGHYQDLHHEGGEGLTTTFSLDPTLASVLRELLPYYDRVAEQIDAQEFGLESSPFPPLQDLHTRSFRSMRTIAALESRLGNYKASNAALVKALERLPKTQISATRRRVTAATLDAEKAMNLELLGDRDGAMQLRLAVIEQLSDPKVKDDWAAQYQRAKTRFLLTRPLLPGMGPDLFPPPPVVLREGELAKGPRGPRHNRSIADEHRRLGLDETKALVTRASDREPQKQKMAKRLLAAFMMEQARTRSGPRSDRQRVANQEIVQNANQILRDLIVQHPDDPSLRFDLAWNISDINVFIPVRMEALPTLLQRLNEGESIFRSLHQENPYVPQYTLCLLHARFKIARLLERPNADWSQTNPNRIPRDRGQDETPQRERLTRAMELYRSAAQAQTRLLELHPESSAYRVWQAVFFEHLAETQMQLGFFGGAKRSCQKISEILPQIPDEKGQRRRQFDRLRERNEDRMKSIENWSGLRL